MNTYYAYVRVSTARQGAEGVSLYEQRASISADILAVVVSDYIRSLREETPPKFIALCAHASFLNEDVPHRSWYYTA